MPWSSRTLNATLLVRMVSAWLIVVADALLRPSRVRKYFTSGNASDAVDSRRVVEPRHVGKYEESATISPAKLETSSFPSSLVARASSTPSVNVVHEPRPTLRENKDPTPGNDPGAVYPGRVVECTHVCNGGVSAQYRRPSRKLYASGRCWGQGRRLRRRSGLPMMGRATPQRRWIRAAS